MKNDHSRNKLNSIIGKKMESLSHLIFMDYWGSKECVHLRKGNKWGQILNGFDSQEAVYTLMWTIEYFQTEVWYD